MFRVGFKFDLETYFFICFAVHIVDDFTQGRHVHPIHPDLGRKKFAVGAGGIHPPHIIFFDLVQ